MPKLCAPAVLAFAMLLACVGTISADQLRGGYVAQDPAVVDQSDLPLKALEYTAAPARSALVVNALGGQKYTIKSITYILNYCGVKSDVSLTAVKALYGYKNGAVSMAKYMPAITHGAVTFNPQDNIVFDNVTVPCSSGYCNSLSCSTSCFDIWKDAADAVAKQRVPSLNLTAYPHRIFFLPYNSQCWPFMGYINCTEWTSGYCGIWMNLKASQVTVNGLAFNLGTNFGFRSSGQGTNPYGDRSCVMGAYTGLRFYNAPLSWSAGFITFVAGGDLQRTSQLPAGKWLSFSLPPLSGNSSRCTLRFGPGVTATPESYFVSFRQPTGFDLGLPSEARNVVQVHLYDGTQNSKTQSWLQANLPLKALWSGNSSAVAGKTVATPKVMVFFDSITANQAKIRVCRWSTSASQCYNTKT